MLWPPANEIALTPSDVVVEIVKKLGSGELDGGFGVQSTMKDLCLEERTQKLLTKHHFVSTDVSVPE